MAGSWTAEETRALIAIWSQESVQDELKRVHRNRDIFQRISMELEDCGFPRTWQQCRTRIKNLTAKYRKIKDHNNVSGNDRENWEYFDQFDAILGTRPTSVPVSLVLSGTDDSSQVPSSALNDDHVDPDETQADDPDLIYVPEEDDTTLVPDTLGTTTVEQTSTTASVTTSATTTTTTVTSQQTIPATTVTTTAGDTAVASGSQQTSSAVGAGRRKGLKRKTAKESWMSTELATVLFKMDKEADERWEERERRHLMIEKEEERKRL
ncbi:zinc finger and SCAN domain-containing protein 29-like [Dysidea avara]|uniref:zinc finger and SCAN domain-containing protein 29-like n=1 Tax=Dysidea avara TaxID=196820 RepID=UPI0033275055